MNVLVASHPSSVEHDTSRNHPERPERVGAVLRGIDDSGLEVVTLESPEILRSELALVHDPEYIAMLETFCRLGGGALDMDTIVSSETWEASLTAAGGVAALTRAMSDGFDGVGFAMTRPPGHHSFADRAMGFCLFNNVAVTAALLRSQGERIAILDWDVHHGNGTQSIVIDDPGILYVSLHQSPFYPYEGEIEDIEVGAAKGTTINIPLPAGTGGDVYLRAWAEVVLPVVAEFSADWVLISAGYDSHVNDYLGQFRLKASDFGMLAATLARVHEPNRTVIALEGGYDLDALRESTAATLRGFSGEVAEEEPLTSPPEATAALEMAVLAISRHWSL